MQGVGGSWGSPNFKRGALPASPTRPDAAGTHSLRDYQKVDEAEQGGQDEGEHHGAGEGLVLELVVLQTEPASVRLSLRHEGPSPGRDGPPREEGHPHTDRRRACVWLPAAPAPVTHLSLPLSLLVLEGEEVQVCHLQLHLPGFQEATDVPVDAGARGGVDDVGREGQAVSELFRGCSQGPALWPSGKEGAAVKSPRSEEGDLGAPHPPTPSSHRHRQSLGPEMQPWLHHLLVVTSQVSYFVIGDGVPCLPGG